MDSKTPALKQLMDAYAKEQASVIGVQPVVPEDVSSMASSSRAGEKMACTS